MSSIIHLSQIGSGAYGSVYLARKGNTDVAIKRNSIEKEVDGIGCLREMTILKTLKGSPYVVDLQDLMFDDKKDDSWEISGRSDPNRRDDDMHFVLEYIPLCGDKFFKDKSKCTPKVAKFLLCQLLLSLEYMHSKYIIHRDLKPSNILIKKEGGKYTIKVCDFGMGDIYSSSYPSKKGVTTSWYRAPEVCFGASDYDFKVDVWAAGCVAFDLFGNDTFMRGSQSTPDELLKTMLERVRGIDRNYYEKMLEKHYNVNTRYRNNNPRSYTSRMGINPRVVKDHQKLEELLNSMLAFNPADRCTASEALDFPYFDDYRNYIKDVRETYPPRAGFLEVNTIKNTSARVTGVNLFFKIYNQRNRYTWYTHRMAFHALDLYERWLLKEPAMEKLSKNDLHFRMYICYYMSHKYFCLMDVHSPWTDIFDECFHTPEHRSFIPKFERFVIENVINHCFYRVTLAECPSFFEHKTSEDLIRKLVSEYGNTTKWSRSVRALYRKIMEIPDPVTIINRHPPETRSIIDG